MEEEKHWFSQEEEDVSKVVQRFERMKRNNENYFFDVIEFETIIDYYLEHNNQARAFEAASIASRQHPNSVPIQLRNARVLLDRGRIAEALRILKKLETIEPGNHEIFLAKGTALCMKGDIQGARKMFDIALTRDSDDVENILFSITSILQNLNYYQEVIPYLKKLIELEPFYPEHLYDLAYAYERTEDYTNSIKFYKEFLDENPFSDSAWYNLGMIYSKLEKYTEAVESYDFALAISNQNDFALLNKGIALSCLGRHDEAIQIYHEFLQDDPDNFEALTLLAEAYCKTDNINLARKYYYEAVEIVPDFADPYIGLAVIEMNEGDIDKCLGYLRKAAELDSGNPEIWFLTGKAFRLKNNQKRAIRCYQEALKLDPYFNNAWFEIGKIIFEKNLIERTLPVIVKAHKIIGDLPGINYLMAAIYYHTGNKESAFSHLKTALIIDRNSFNIFREFFPETNDNNLNKEFNELLNENLK